MAIHCGRVAWPETSQHEFSDVVKASGLPTPMLKQCAAMCFTGTVASVGKEDYVRIEL